MLPFFYQDFKIQEILSRLVLNTDNSKHIVQVLRMQVGDLLHITNGQGVLLTATITLAHKKHCEVKITAQEQFIRPQYEQWLGISFTKNRSRTEWLMEKVTEMGITGIIPLECQRSERLNWNKERLQKIIESAMIQSQQTFLPQLTDSIPLERLWDFLDQQKINHLLVGIAHCEEDGKEELRTFIQTSQSHLILIGPEGDFNTEEIAFSKQMGAKPISLGPSRLRTETAGLYSATLLNALTYENS